MSGALLRRIDDDVWVSEAPLRFLGMEVGARMTVLRLPGGQLFLHSPITASSELVAEVAALGNPAFLVAPNKMHHLYIGQWKDAFPEAKLYLAPGLEAKRSDLPFDGILGEKAEAGWVGTIDQTLLEGMPAFNEVVFFHEPSATLIGTDIAFNFGPDSAPFTKLAMKLGGTYGRLAPTLLERLLTRDKVSLRRSLERIFEWPFGRVIVAHGDVCENGGREELKRGYGWALGG